MKYLRKFENKSDYNSSKCSINEPIISFVNEDLSCNCIDLNIFKCVYDVTSIDEPTVLCRSYNTVKNMIIDGEEVENCSAYTFNSLGIHIVEFNLGTCSYVDAPNFYNMPNLIEAYVPNMVSSINFRDCENLNKLQFEDRSKDKKDITINAIYNCPSLRELIFPNCEVGMPGDMGCLFQNLSLEKLVFPKGCKIDMAFHYGITSGITKVDNLIYENGAEISICNSFSNVKIGNLFLGDSVYNIYEPTPDAQYYRHSAFGSFDHVVVDENNPYYDSRDNCNAVIETDTNEMICCTCTTTIPDTVEILTAFYGCDKTSVEIPDNIKRIASDIFKYSKLKSITLGKGLESIGDEFCYHSSKLSSITMKSLVAPTFGTKYEPFIGCSITGTFTYPKGSDYSSYRNLSRLASWTFVESEDLI